MEPPSTAEGVSTYRGGGKRKRWAWQAGPAYSCRCKGGLDPEATEIGLGCAGPVLFNASHREPGCA
eukprot:1826512-Amphidinium_carterae.1